MAEETTFNIVNQAVADPSTLGLASFGIGLFTLSFLNAGFVGPKAMSVIIPLALLCGLTHLVVAFNGFKKNELFTALVFGIFSQFWFVYGLINLGVVLKWFELDVSTLLIWLVAYTIVTLYILIASLVTNKAVILTVALLLAVFVLLDLGLAGYPALVTFAGYVGIVDALMALYLSAAGLTNTLYGRSIFPVGPIVR